MDLRHLRFFLAVVDEGGFRRASHALYVGQPAVSRTLRQLEHEMGVSLFNRSARGIELTDAGVELVEHARLVVATADLARDAMRKHAARRSVLRIGAGPLCAGELTDPIVRRFLHSHPDLEVTVDGVAFRDQIGDVLAGDTDVAIVRGPDRPPGPRRDPDRDRAPIPDGRTGPRLRRR